jgi:hypothetical protein
MFIVAGTGFSLGRIPKAAERGLHGVNRRKKQLPELGFSALLLRREAGRSENQVCITVLMKAPHFHLSPTQNAPP